MDALETFNALKWHDSKLVGMSLDRIAEEDQIIVKLMLWAGDRLAPHVLTFKDPTIVDLNFDLTGKQLCADDISSADCQTSSDWISELSRNSPHDNFAGYLHFEIRLIPPGGRLRILAKTFDLRTADQQSKQHQATR
jgi:hypothetical protein